MKSAGLFYLADMSVAGDDVLVGGQLLQTHGASGVELLGGDAHLAAQTELAAVGKPGGGVDVDGGAVHAGDEGGLGQRCAARPQRSSPRT